MKMSTTEIQAKINELLQRGHNKDDMVIGVLTARLQNLNELASWNN